MIIVMKTALVNDRFSVVPENSTREKMETYARMSSTKTAVVFQGRKRYEEAEEEE